MDKEFRGSYMELLNLMEKKTLFYYGAMRCKIKNVENRRDRVFITLEETTGAVHDCDKDLRTLDNFLSRLKFAIEKETVEVDLFVAKPLTHNKKDYDVASVWRRGSEAVFIVFSADFSSSDYLKKNKRFIIANAKNKPSLIYLIPSIDKSARKLFNRTSTRVGLWCKHVSNWVTSDEYNVELVELNGVTSIKLVVKP